MSALWIGPLAIAAGAGVALVIVTRALQNEKHASRATTDSLRALRPALAASRRRTAERLAPGDPGPKDVGEEP
ncbi:MAG TPA: hypothetical protein VKU91_05655 [Acidimicrobiales bacterium]|nr:hypothetical protein [Acidimicrobiales bacterium]